MSAPIQIVPVNDLREHAPSADCWCEPRILEDAHVTDTDGEDVVATLVVHHALDGRERHERQN